MAAGDEMLPSELRLNALSDGLRAGHDAASAALVRRFVASIDELVQSGVSDPSRANWIAIQALRDLGDPMWMERASELLRTSPGSAAASQALDALERAGIPVPTYTAALVRYRARDDDRATALFREATRNPASSSVVANASFYLGALAERRGDDSAAIDAYSSSLRAAPAGGLGADAHWWRGLLLQSAGKVEASLTDFHVVVDEFPTSQFADEAASQAALLEWRTGRPVGEERLRWVIANRPVSEAAEAARVLTLTRLAFVQDQSPVSLAPFSFAAIRGQGLGVTSANQLNEWNGSPRSDWPEVDQWLRGRFGEPTTERPAAASLALAEAADAVGESAPARLAWLAAIFYARRDPYESLRLARIASERGRPDIAMAAATNLVAPVSSRDLLRVPRTILQLLYPVPHADAVRLASNAQGIPPFLLLALVRQESAFQVDARSPVGALGLTQIMPETGRTIAASLGIPWQLQLLTNPESSIELGSKYLADTLRRYKGEFVPAVSAYNAGMGAADRWLTQARGDQEAFVEAVDYPETQTYIARVLENYAAYRFVYGFAETPRIR